MEGRLQEDEFHDETVINEKPFVILRIFRTVSTGIFGVLQEHRCGPHS